MIDGKTLYEQHRDEVESFGIPRPRAWQALPRAYQAAWEQAASDLAEKMLNDEKEVPA